MAKIKNKGYTVNRLKEILPHLKEDSMRTILTEHFLEKMEHRSIDDDMIYEVLENQNPKSIVRLRDSGIDFKLTYDWDEVEDLVIILAPHLQYCVIIISAYFQEVFDEDCQA